MQPIQVPIQVQKGASLPTYQTAQSAGVDVSALVDITLLPGERKVVPTGLALAIPEGYEVQVRPRSGLSLKTSLRLANSPGTIDADYRDEVGLILENTFSLTDVYSEFLRCPKRLAELEASYHKSNLMSYLNEQGQKAPEELQHLPIWLDEEGQPYGTLRFKAGDRLAQLVLAKVEQAQFIEVPDVKVIGEDRGGGFGSTGI